MPDRLCVDRTCTICETLLWCPAWRGLAWSGVVYPSVTLGLLTPHSSSPGRGLHADISVCAQPGHCQHMLLPSLPAPLTLTSTPALLVQSTSPTTPIIPNSRLLLKHQRSTMTLLHCLGLGKDSVASGSLSIRLHEPVIEKHVTKLFRQLLHFCKY